MTEKRCRCCGVRFPSRSPRHVFHSWACQRLSAKLRKIYERRESAR